MKSREILMIAITIFLTVAVVALSDLYKVSRTSQVPASAIGYLEPINVNISKTKLELIKARLEKQ